MKIEHVALWAKDLEQTRDFYVEFFGGRTNDRYTNSRTGFESYFITFETGARLEIMRMPGIPDRSGKGEGVGYTHVAFSVGSREGVDELTERLRGAGYSVVSEPRQTGDGYYESCVLDPEGNRVEITG